MDRTKAKKAFVSHRSEAKSRGLAFGFTFEEWVGWWEAKLGPDWQNKRGCSTGKFVMARNGDLGGYEEGNVRCILHSDNLSERKALANGTIPSGSRHYQAKLTEEQVREARRLHKPRSSKDGASGRALAKRFGVSVATMAECLRGDTWKTVKDGG